MQIMVIKKDGKLEQWNSEKIKLAVRKSAANVKNKGSKIEEEIDDFITSIEFKYKDRKVVRVEEIHEEVMAQLYNVDRDVYRSYKAYRQLRASGNYSEVMLETYEEVKKIIDVGDNENANKESRENNAKHALIGEAIEKKINKTFEMDPKWIKAHDEGYIHIHDLSSRLLPQQNCTVADVGNILRGGFTHAGVRYSEPGGVQKAMDIAGDIVLSMSSDQYGGFSFPDVDKEFAYYTEKTYRKALEYFLENIGEEIEDFDPILAMNIANKLAKKQTIREIEQGWQSFETKLNTISNALGQIPFVTVSFGLDTTYWGREITKAALNFRLKGLGENHVTAIFPKTIFLHRAEVNGNIDSPNYDLKELAIECSTKRLYPDWLSADSGFQKEVYEETNGNMITPMGCRSFLGKMYHPNTGKLITKGRGNVGVVTLNLPMYAIEARRESQGNEFIIMTLFKGKIKKYLQTAYEIHLDAYEKIGKAKGSSNPLMFCEGGAWDKVGYDEEIKKLTDTWTSSIGYIGLEEVCQALFNQPLKEKLEFGTELVKFLSDEIEKEKEKTGKAFSIYGTPAESLIERFQNINRKKFGYIQEVTSREYMTNSFHQGVWQKIYPYEKIDFESPMFDLTLGGRISYCEWPHGINPKILQQTLDYAMKKGMYWGVNIESATCNDCGHQGEFNVCPTCGSKNITDVNRTCGYLSYSKINGQSRYNKGKQAEIRDRIDHVSVKK